MERWFIGHVAFKVDEEMVKYILRDTGIASYDHLTVDILDKALAAYEEGSRSRLFGGIFTSREQVDKANKNWDRLESALGREFLLYQAIDGLKYQCPASKRGTPLSQDEITEYLGTEGNEQDKNTTLQLLHILDHLLNN